MLFMHVAKIVNVLGVVAQQGAPDCGPSLSYHTDGSNANLIKKSLNVRVKVADFFCLSFIFIVIVFQHFFRRPTDSKPLNQGLLGL